MSGVFYIEVPETQDHLGGSIIFSPNGYDYPIKKESDDLIIKPKSGEIIFFLHIFFIKLYQQNLIQEEYVYHLIFF